MKLFVLLIICFSFATLSFASMVDVVPVGSKLYNKITYLIKNKIITDYKENFSGENEVSRYDFADSLIEPAERCVAIAVAHSGKELTPAQKRRNELLTNLLQNMKQKDIDNIFETIYILSDEFSYDIEQLVPGLPLRIKEAFKIIKDEKISFVSNKQDSTDNIVNTFHFSVSTLPNPNSILSPIHYTPADLVPNMTGSQLLMQRSPGDDSIPVNINLKNTASLEASLDIAINRALLYGSISSIPSKNPLDSIIPDGTGKAMVGVKYDLITINNFDIAGIVEFHIIRTGESGNRDIKTGAVGGIGIKW